MGYSTGEMVLFGVIGVLIIGLAFFAWKSYKERRDQFINVLAEIDVWLDLYRSKVNTESRILCNKTLLREAFPEVSDILIMDLWDEMVKRRWVVIDGRDGEWIVGK